MEREPAGASRTSTLGSPTPGRRDLAADLRDVEAGRRDVVAQQRDGSAGERDAGAGVRDDVTDGRDGEGRSRDDEADLRDQADTRRDRAAQGRDAAAEQRDRPVHAPTTWQEGFGRMVLARRAAAADRELARQDRMAGAGSRTRAGADRDSSRHDRRHSATDREAAGSDRNAASDDRGAGEIARAGAVGDRHGAQVDRDEAALDRRSASLDDLTGAYLRRPGLLELERDVGRARRDGRPLVVAFLDVDRLKTVNDQSGHAAGDQLLHDVAHVVQAQLRPHDLIIRFGGDEFVCVVTGLPPVEVASRLTAANALLGRRPVPGSVTFGLAELEPDDTAVVLIARADQALYRQRDGRPPTS